MTILEKKSENKKKAIILLVKAGEMSVGYALLETERFSDEGKLLDKDYEELIEFLESLIPVEEEPVEETEETTEETEQTEEVTEEE